MHCPSQKTKASLLSISEAPPEQNTMTNNDLKNAKDEITRLKILLNMKIDGEIEEENGDKIRSGMLKRVRILDEISEMKNLKDKMEEARNVYLEKKDNYNKTVIMYTKNSEELNSMVDDANRTKKELADTKQLQIDLKKQMSDSYTKIMELNSKLNSKNSFSCHLNDKKRNHSQYERSLDSQTESLHSSKEKFEGLKRKYEEAESKFNPGKRKEMEELSIDFEERVDISGKRNRLNSI